MRIQADSKVRIVALSNLEAMCEHVSGVCHRYWVDRVTRHSVVVGYSNPNEYGSENPMYARFVAYPVSDFGEDPKEARMVVMEIQAVTNDTWGGEGWQAFQCLLDCPHLWRSNPDSNDWATEEAIRARQAQA